VGEGFAEICKRSARIMEGEIFTRRAVEDELEVEPELMWYIVIPGSTLGSAYSVEGKRIGCKSEGHANHIMSRKGFVREQLLGKNWFQTAEQAAKYAYDLLLEKARFDAEKPSTIEEAVERLCAAELLDPRRSLSPTWFKKPLSRKRVALALRGDKQSIGLIRRDSFSNLKRETEND